MLIALIPAYNPSPDLLNYLYQIRTQQVFQHIVVVNDGSRSDCDTLFQALPPEVTLLNHATNQGKGAALKTGLNHIGYQYPDALGVVTIDADGQHTVEDACRVAQALIEHKDHLIIGGRKFDKGTPWRSLIGNFFTRHAFRLVVGLNLFDTQSGLRGIPKNMIKHLLHIEANGYEFELDMLIRSKHWGIPVLEIPIQTVYIEGNKHSSFRPLQDSLRIYFVLLRFSLIAVLSALVDYGIFILIYYLVHPSVLFALTGGRIVSTAFNYFNVRRYAFRADTSHWRTVPKYLILACFSGVMAWLLITEFMAKLHWHVVTAKVIAEAIMFVVNFLIQRDFIFKRKLYTIGELEN